MSLGAQANGAEGEAPPLLADHLSRESAAAGMLALADVLVLVDHEGMIKAAAFGSDRQLSGSLKFPAGRAWTEMLAPDSVAKGRDMIASARPGEHSRGREVNHRGMEAGRHVTIRYAVIAQEGGDVLLIGRSLQPEAELQRQLLDAQQAMERDYSRLRGVETRYRALFQLSGTAMLIADAGTRKVLEANGACLALFGISAARATGRGLASLFVDHDGSALQQLITTAIASGEATGALLRTPGGEHPLQVSANLFRQDGGSLLLLQARPAQDGLAVANSVIALPSLIERLPEGFVITDGEGLVLEANRTFLDLAELPMMGAAVGQSLGRWLGRAALDFGVMLASLHEHGAVRGFPTVARGGFGAQEPVEVSAVRIEDHDAPRIGFLIRADRRKALPASPAHVVANLPRSIEQMKELVGAVPLKELVRETTDVIERLCIEAALELTNDNRASAADMLGLSRQSLYAKLHRFGLGDLGQSETP